jgi:hypothetical protein
MLTPQLELALREVLEHKDPQVQVQTPKQHYANQQRLTFHDVVFPAGSVYTHFACYWRSAQLTMMVRARYLRDRVGDPGIGEGHSHAVY